MKHKTIIIFRGEGRSHGVFMVGRGDWVYRRDPYHACGAFKVVEGGGVEIGPFTSLALEGATKAQKQVWMVRNWMSARRAFAAEGFGFWIYERLEADGSMSWHKEHLKAE